MNQAETLCHRPNSAIRNLCLRPVHHSSLKFDHSSAPLSPQTPSLPVPRPANDSTREKQIPFRDASDSTEVTLTNGPDGAFTEIADHAYANGWFEIDPIGLGSANLSWFASVFTSSGMQGWVGTELSVRCSSYINGYRYNSIFFSKHIEAMGSSHYDFEIDPDTGIVTQVLVPAYGGSGEGSSGSDSYLVANTSASIGTLEATFEFDIRGLGGGITGKGAWSGGLSLGDSDETASSYIKLSTGVGVANRKVAWRYVGESAWKTTPAPNGTTFPTMWPQKVIC